MTAVITSELAREDFCYLSTTGRRTGTAHTIEIWFAVSGSTLYMLAGGRERADWVRNLRRDPRVEVRIRGQTWRGAARVVEDHAERAAAADLVFSKYASTYGGRLEDWRERALPVAVELETS